MDVVLYSCVSLTLLTLSIILSWYLRFTRMYSEFPSFPIARHLLYSWLMRKIPKNVPFTSYIFQEIINNCSRFKTEGLCIFWLGEPVLVVFGEEAIKVITTEPEATDKPKIFNRPLEFVFGNGLITSNGERWKKHRKLMNPAFHLGVIKDKFPIFNEHAACLVETLKNLESKPTNDVLDILRFCATFIFCASILGFKAKKEEHVRQIKRMMELITELSKFLVYKMYNPQYFWNFTSRLTQYGRRNIAYYEEAFNFSRKILNEMKELAQIKNANQLPETGDEIYGQNRKSLAEILLNLHQNDPSFTMDDLQHHANTFIVAGFDTVSYTVVWCLFLLGLHPDVQERAHQEVDSVTKNDIQYDDLHKLPYLECIIKETLRLYPTVPLYARSLTKDIQYGKYKVPKDTTVAIFPYLSHRDPRIYPEPEKFDPDRFLEKNSDKRSWTFIPFAEGIRHCIGKNFAMMEMKVILAHILQNFKVTSLSCREDLNLSWQIVLTNDKPLPMQFTPRQPLI